MSDPYPQLILCLLLLLLNALLTVGGEGIKNLNKALLNRKEEEGDKTAKKIAVLLEKPGYTFRAALRTGRALCKIAAAGLILHAFPLKPESSAASTFEGMEILYYILLLLATTAVFLLFGELYPIRAAGQKADSIIYVIWSPLRVIASLFYPIALPINGLASLLLHISGLKQAPDEALSKEEIQTLVEESGDSGLLEEQERDMLEGIFDFNEKTADQVMTPRTEVFLVDADQPLKEYLEQMLNEKYSRIPVYRDTIDNIIGILYLKDLLCEAYQNGFEKVDITRCMREAYFVPEKKPLNDLYRNLQQSKNHMAVLIDEYGGFSGIVTIEDLIEEVMGNIEDEYDEPEEEVRSEDDGSYVADGSVTIGEINEHLGIELDENNEDYDTVGGLIIKLLGYIPEEDEDLYLEYEGCGFKVEKISDRRIETVRIVKLERDEEADSDS